MTSPARKYDVAFSFLTRDLPLAKRLAEALEPGLSSFVFSEQQKILAAGDGMETFGRVFGKESRLNVVLYSANYGADGFTNFECDVIKARVFQGDGWDSFALYKTDGSPVPNWVPRSYIYGSTEVMQFESIVDSIRYRASMAGAIVQRDTAADRLARLSESRAFDEETERQATSREAFDAVEINIQSVVDSIATAFQGVSKQPSGLRGRIGREGSIIGGNLGGLGFYLNYNNQFGSVTHGMLRLRFFDGEIATPGSQSMLFDHPNEVARDEFKVARSKALGWCWKHGERVVTSIEVADFVLNGLIARIPRRT